jgi:hypothetical protein
MDQVATRQTMIITGILNQKAPHTGCFRRRVIMRACAAKPCRSSGCDLPPSRVVSRLVPRGDSIFTRLVGYSAASERLVRRSFPAIRRELQHPRPTSGPSVPFVAKKYFATPPPPPTCRESICEYSFTKKHIGHAEREIPVLVYEYCDF